MTGLPVEDAINLLRLTGTEDERQRGKAWALAQQGFKVWCNDRGATYINNTFMAASPEAFR